MASYRQGTVTVTQGSKIVTGVDTAFNVVGIYAGDIFSLVDGNNIPTGSLYEVASVESDTKLTLLQAYQGTSGSAKNYVIMNMAGNQTTPRFSAKVSNLLGEIQPIADGLSEDAIPGGIPQADGNGKVSRDWFTINAANGLLGLDSSGKAAAAQLPDAALAPRENLLHNWDFRNPVNQRGASEYSTTRKYTIDRWFIISGGGKVTKGASGITVNGSGGAIYFVQPLEFLTGLKGQKVTLSAEVVSGSGRMGIYTGNDIFSTTNVAGSKTVSGAGIASMAITIPADASGYACVYLACYSGESMAVSRVKLEIGSESSLENSAPMDYGKEVAVCKRYCVVFATDARARMVSYGSSYMDAVFPSVATMRASPSVESGSVVLCNLSGSENAATVSSIGFYGYSNGIWMRANTESAHGMTDGFIKVKGGSLIISADI